MMPDDQNELRKLQLRELALLNGTLRPDCSADDTRCSNCGSDQHKASIQTIISQTLMMPDDQNELRKLQLRELALLNGTLRPDCSADDTRCSNCGSDQHKASVFLDISYIFFSFLLEYCQFLT
ncbi:unnamed protein product [Gongylonema pulchrum]|uniref:Branchpoint-bridging protein n=1 Tax=Gongylonema pulchrum TaxID=637853 RepID=A0A183ERT5_9BILA|nr:unnamed protein product [Gongylonema pulchrum]